MELPGGVRRLLQTLTDQGHEAWVVGGAVRDQLLGLEPVEWDVATSARAEEVAALFPRVIATGLRHGTVTVLLDGHPTEVTTYRGGAAWSGEEGVFVGSIEEDLARRDLTINAMALDPLRSRFLDPAGGRADLQRRCIRAVGDPDERFDEDPLRPMRAVRFAARFGFVLERGTRRAMGRHAARLGGVAVERIQHELSRILLSDHPRYGIELLRRTGLLREVLPELLEGLGMRQNRFHRYDVYHHVLRALDAAPGELTIRLATLLHDIDKPRTAAPSEKSPGDLTFHNHEFSGAERAKEICLRLRFPNRVCEEVQHLVREHQFVYTDEWSDAATRRMIARVGRERLEPLMAVREADIRGRGFFVEEGLANLRALRERVDSLLREDAAFRIRDLDIDGADVMRTLRLGPSPRVGEALRWLLQQVLEDPSRNRREELLRLLEEYQKETTGNPQGGAGDSGL